MKFMFKDKKELCDCLVSLYNKDGHEEMYLVAQPGLVVTACLCAEPRRISDISEAEYVLVYGPCWTGALSGTPDEFLAAVGRADEIKADWEAERDRLYAWFQSAERTQENFDWFSDWHKDVFHYRPRGWVFNARNAA